MKTLTGKSLALVAALLLTSTSYANYSSNSGSASMDSSTIMQAQQALSDNGYNVSVDGRAGPQTRSALKRFQAEKGLTETGRFDSRTLEALGVSATELERAPSSVPSEY